MIGSAALGLNLLTRLTTGLDLLVATTAGRGSYGIRVAPLAVGMALATGGASSNTTTPIIVGYSEQSAFGNKVHVKLYDITDPNNRILLGEVDTDPTGKFTIPVNNPVRSTIPSDFTPISSICWTRSSA